MGNEMFARVLAFDYGDAERAALMAKVWTPTPFVVEAWTGMHDNDRGPEMMDWCRDRLGDECRPIHGKAGRWQRGSSTVFGWTWFGFDTAEALAEFEAAWPVPAVRP